MKNTTKPEELECRRLTRKINQYVRNAVNAGIVTNEDVARAQFLAREQQRQKAKPTPTSG